MSGRAYTSEERGLAEQVGIALRRTGADMQTVADATGVGLSTLHRWAREHGWRSADLAQDGRMLMSASDVGGSDVAAGASAGAHAGTVEGIETSDTPRTPEPAQPAEVAAHLFGQAVMAASGGNLLTSSRALRLAEQFGAMAEAQPVEAQPVADVDLPESELRQLERDRAELRERLLARYQERIDLAAAGKLDPLSWRGDEGVMFVEDPRQLRPQVYYDLLCADLIARPIPESELGCLHAAERVWRRSDLRGKGKRNI